jgi:endonuclease YncB( thermonuclease family)
MHSSHLFDFSTRGIVHLTRFFVVSLLSLATVQVHASTVQGSVVGVTDGDTITVLDTSNTKHKIRLSGIDAPEKGQAFGQRSKQSLSNLVFSKSVTVQSSKRDRYGREIGKVLVNGLDVNLEQIRLGMAWHYKAYQREQSPQDRAEYSEAEQRARQVHTGLWQDPAPVPPWDFRHGSSNVTEAQ